MNVPWWNRALHGTGARARRHQRDGETPLRRHCPACADADLRERRLRAGTKVAGYAQRQYLTSTTANDNRGTAAA